MPIDPGAARSLPLLFSNNTLPPSRPRRPPKIDKTVDLAAPLAPKRTKIPCLGMLNERSSIAVIFLAGLNGQKPGRSKDLLRFLTSIALPSETVSCSSFFALLHGNQLLACFGFFAPYRIRSHHTAKQG